MLIYIYIYVVIRFNELLSAQYLKKVPSANKLVARTDARTYGFAFLASVSTDIAQTWRLAG